MTVRTPKRRALAGKAYNLAITPTLTVSLSASPSLLSMQSLEHDKQWRHHHQYLHWCQSSTGGICYCYCLEAFEVSSLFLFACLTLE